MGCKLVSSWSCLEPLIAIGSPDHVGTCILNDYPSFSGTFGKCSKVISWAGSALSPLRIKKQYTFVVSTKSVYFSFKGSKEKNTCNIFALSSEDPSQCNQLPGKLLGPSQTIQELLYKETWDFRIFWQQGILACSPSAGRAREGALSCFFRSKRAKDQGLLWKSSINL